MVELTKELRDSASGFVSKTYNEEQSLRQRALVLESSLKKLRSSIDDAVARGAIDRSVTEKIVLPEKPDTEDEAELRKWKWQIRGVKKENSERHSQRCDIELKLAVARKMEDEDGFFYPHNLDFRGRAYPMHPHLYHLVPIYAVEF